MLHEYETVRVALGLKAAKFYLAQHSLEHGNAALSAPVIDEAMAAWVRGRHLPSLKAIVKEFMDKFETANASMSGTAKWNKWAHEELKRLERKAEKKAKKVQRKCSRTCQFGQESLVDEDELVGESDLPSLPVGDDDQLFTWAKQHPEPLRPTTLTDEDQPDQPASEDDRDSSVSQIPPAASAEVPVSDCGDDLVPLLQIQDVDADGEPAPLGAREAPQEPDADVEGWLDSYDYVDGTHVPYESDHHAYLQFVLEVKANESTVNEAELAYSSPSVEEGDDNDDSDTASSVTFGR